MGFSRSCAAVCEEAIEIMPVCFAKVQAAVWNFCLIMLNADARRRYAAAHRRNTLGGAPELVSQASLSKPQKKPTSRHEKRELEKLFAWRGCGLGLDDSVKEKKASANDEKRIGDIEIRPAPVVVH